MNKIDETLPILWKQKHPSGRGKEQTKREDQHPTKRTSLKSANTEQRLQINPFALKLNKLELVQLPRETKCTFWTDAHLQPLAKKKIFFFWFNFVMYPNWWSTRTLAKFGYRPDMKVEKLMNPFMCWLPAGTCCKNLEVKKIIIINF